MKITILTLFPEMFTGFIETSIIKKAILKEAVEIQIVNIRDYTKDKHTRCDDYPFGGGAGLVMQAQPVIDAIRAVSNEHSHIAMMTPQGKTFDQAKAKSMRMEIQELVLVCGHYEGFDERIRSFVDEEISIGDFVLTGGELPAMVISDALIRLLDNVITTESYENDSFEDGLLEYPHYTRPLDFEGMLVPEVLRSGHHEKIRQWRLKQSLKKTLKVRPDLIEKRVLTKEEQKFLEEIKQGKDD